MQKNIAVIGCGYWGKNLIRNYFELGALYSVCDQNIILASEYSESFNVKVQDYDEILNDKNIDGVVIASPAPTHMDLCCSLIEANKNIFVEKPLCMNMNEANQIKNALRNKDSILMVGHLLQYHPGYRKLISEIRSGKHGEVKHIISKRNSFGRIRSNEDVLWSFAPHDISMILGISQSYPKKINRTDYSFIQKGLADRSLLSLEFDNYDASIEVSWMYPSKEQNITVICEDSILIFNDTLPWNEKVSCLSYECSINANKEKVLTKKNIEYFALPNESEPLKLECKHFLDLIDKKVDNITNIDEAMRVIQVLEAAVCSESNL